MSPLPPVQPAEEFAASLRRALQAAPPAGPALPYCGLGDVGCNGKSPSCACLDYLFECDPTAGTCSPMTVGMAVLVVGALVLLWLCCSKEDEDGYEPIDSAESRRDMLRLPHPATDAECEAALPEVRKQGTAEQKKLEKAAKAAGAQVSLPTSATACAAPT